MARLASVARAWAGRISAWHLAVIYALSAVIVSLQKYNADSYNNYKVFTQSLKVLLAHQDLYAPHPEYYGDLYKYSPTFPLFMAPLTWLPFAFGLICWNLLNVLALYAALTTLWPGQRRAVVALLLVTIELVISLQHTQSNALVAALIILAFAELERARSWRAGFYVVAGFFLKGYGAAVGCLVPLYRWRVRTIGAGAFWFAALAAAPLVALSTGELFEQYRQWLHIGGTFTVMRNTSIMRVALQHVDASLDPRVIQLAGLAIFALPFARVSAWSDPRFRLRLLCSLLIALVIFNNSAEPPTYVIASAGAAIWYASEPTRSRLDRSLTLSLLIATMVVSTDVYPRALRNAVAGPWTVKAVGYLLMWLRINWELLTGSYARRREVRLKPDTTYGGTTPAGTASGPWALDP